MFTGPEQSGDVFMKTSSQGFSLIEVVLALGVVSFTLAALLGLLPVGLNTLRQTMNTTAEAQIMQTVSSALQVSDFKPLASSQNLPGCPRYFNEEGQRALVSADIAYDVVCRWSPVRLPGNSADSNSSCRVVVEITRTREKNSVVRHTVWMVDRGL